MNVLGRTALVVAGLAVAACSGAAAEGGRINLTGRDLCGPSTENRLAASMMGQLELGPYPWTLMTPEGEPFTLDFRGLTINAGANALVDGSGTTLANEGEMVTVFGGYGSDEILLVCSIDERHPA